MGTADAVGKGVERKTKGGTMSKRHRLEGLRRRIDRLQSKISAYTSELRELQKKEASENISDNLKKSGQK